MKELARALAVILTLVAGCGRSEIKGTYDVELEIAGAARPLEGTLILSTLPLDIPSLAEDDSSIDSNWFGGDAIAANSCFILETSAVGRTSANDRQEPGIVRVFDARIEPGHVVTPIEILNASDLRIVIRDLQFFADAIGGELDVHMAQGTRPGRITGTRVGPPSAVRCTESLATFRAYLRELPVLDTGASQ